jgi:Holliday junction resolvasome RuvABC endonuclease subunit
MLILGVDPGTRNLGIAVLYSDDDSGAYTLVHSDCVDVKIHRGNNISQITSRLFLLFKYLEREHGIPDAIVIEKQKRGACTAVEAAAITYGLFGRRVVLSADNLRVKSFFRTRCQGRKKNKLAALDAVRNLLGLSSVRDHNEADAILLCVYGAQLLRGRDADHFGVHAVLDDHEAAKGAGVAGQQSVPQWNGEVVVPAQHECLPRPASDYAQVTPQRDRSCSIGIDVATPAGDGLHLRESGGHPLPQIANY